MNLLQDLSDDEGHACRRCQLPISEGHAYELGGDRWHMYCFSCSKCTKLLGTSSNFMVLGTGDLICSDCSYSCNSCGKKIDDLAILTGDQAYCSKCFCCRNCHKKIEDLRYARTSKGLFCMSCHEKLLEKKRVHEQNKRSHAAQRQSQVIDKSLPRLPIEDQFLPQLEQEKATIGPERVSSPLSMISDLSTPGILEVQNTTVVDQLFPPERSPHRQRLSSPIHKTLAPAATVSPTAGVDTISASDSDDEGDLAHVQDQTLNVATPTRQPQILSPLRPTAGKTPNADIKRKAVVMESVSSSSSNNILSSYMNDSPLQLGKPAPLDDLTSKDDSTVADDFIDMDDSSGHDEVVELEQESTYSVEDGHDDFRFDFKPTGFSNSFRVNKPDDLNIDNTNDVSPSQPLRSPMFSKSSPFQVQSTRISPLTNKKQSPEQSVLSRSKTIKSPRNFLNNLTPFSNKHKKSESSSSIEQYKISSPFLTSDNVEHNNNHATAAITTPQMKQVTSPNPPAAASFQTPPLTSRHQRHYSNSSTIPGHTRSGSAGTNHVRSRSDMAPDFGTQGSYSAGGSFSVGTNGVFEERRLLELELRSLKVGILEMKQTKVLLGKEIGELIAKRDVLNQEILMLSNQFDGVNVNDEQVGATPPPLLSKGSGEKNILANEQHYEVSSSNSSQQQLESLQVPGTANSDKKSRKFWRRGIFNNNVINSASAYSINNLLGTGENNEEGGISKQLISDPILKTDDVDELGGNDNKKLTVSAGSTNLHSVLANGNTAKYIDLNQSKVSSGSTESATSNINGATSALIMSDLFNSTLESRALFEKRPIPLIITRLVEEVEKRGLDSEGIYRKNGATSQMNNILNSFNNLYQAETSHELESALEGDINAVTSSLKRYMYFILPEPIIPNNLYEEFIKVDKLNSSHDKMDQVISIFKSLPQTNLHTIEFLLKHFSKVEKYNHLNKMNYYNLSVVFGPTFTRVSSSERELMDMKARNNVMEFLLKNSSEIFATI